MQTFSAFTPVNQKFYQQVNGRDSNDHSRKDVIRQSPINMITQPSGRRYRQSELVKQINNLQNELISINQTLALKARYPEEVEHLNNKLRYIEAILHQKQRHLVRLQKNVVVQKTIRNKKRVTQTEI
ncbi:Uncharacterized protein QTN25_005865 [Entamoeba marina]